MAENFVSEAIEPIAESFVPSRVAGEPELPMRFRWRGQDYEIIDVLGNWKESSERYGEGEKYLRKHWYHIRTACDCKMKIYFERQARSASARKQRWWLYTIE